MSKHCIYLKMNANCGNQFFQYAFARMLQEHYGGELIIDYGYIINGYKRNVVGLWPGSDNLLKDFNAVPYTYVRRTSNPKYFWAYFIKLIQVLLHCDRFTPRSYKFYLWVAEHLERYGIYYFEAPYFPYKLNSKSKNIIVKGYFESPKYFAAIDGKIKNELTSKHALLEQDRDLYEVIVKSEAVCITIKRMDVDNSDLADIYAYDIAYFYHAVDYISDRVTNPVWVIFSDDIEWCHNNFHIDGQVYYEPEGNPIWDKVKLMSSCKHFIIHNSTFSWWAQHLSANEDKIVIAPTKWVNRDDQPIDIYEDNWVYMRNDGTIQSTHD